MNLSDQFVCKSCSNQLLILNIQLYLVFGKTNKFMHKLKLRYIGVDINKVDIREEKV